MVTDTLLEGGCQESDRGKEQNSVGTGIGDVGKLLEESAALVLLTGSAHHLPQPEVGKSGATTYALQYKALCV
ncbi:MAG TPA: hypothetical protein VG498_23345 [Terriglobales bacterium]|nr:hypothetical protein [Terriglobales bacterium]